MRFQANILEYGGCRNTGALQTASIQKAIDACRAAGGGEVVIPEGEWHTGSLRLYSDITLYLKSGARLIASENCRDYTDYRVPTSMAYTKDPYFIEFWHLPPHYLNAVITAVECDNVAVIGEDNSEINGSNCVDESGEEGFRGPMGMVFCRCSNVTLKGYQFVDSANWSHQIDACRNVHISGVTVKAGHDGFNVHHCTNVTITDCDLQTGDDCIAGYDVHNFHMKDCQLNTSCNTFRIGCENLLVENCRFYAPGNFPHRISGRTNTLYAFEYYSHQADPVQVNSKNWLIKDCTFEGLDALLHYDFGNELHLQVVKPLENVVFENVKISGLRLTSTFQAGNGGACSLTFRNAQISMAENADTDVFLNMDAEAFLLLQQTVFTGGAVRIHTVRRENIKVKESRGYFLEEN